MSLVATGILAQGIGGLYNASDLVVWLGTSIAIASIVTAPPACQAADYFGRKWITVGSSALGFAGTLWASRAQSIGSVIGGFAFSGLAFASNPIIFSVASEVIRRKHRTHAQAALILTTASGQITGLLMGAALMRYNAFQHFRIYLYVTAALYALSGLGVVFFYRPPPRMHQIELSVRQRLASLDWIGSGLFLIGLTLFCVALAWSGNPYAWNTVQILAPFLIGLAFIALFLVYECKYNQEGLLHHRLFQNRNFALSIVVISGEGLAFFATNAFYAAEYATFTGSDLWGAGLRYLVGFITIIPTAIIGSILSARYKSVKWPCVLGLGVLVIFNVLMATVTPRTNRAVFWGYPILYGAGLGTTFPFILTLGQLSTPSDLIAQATSLIVVGRSLGSLLGLVIFNAILNNTLSRQISRQIASAVAPLGFPATSLPALIAFVRSTPGAHEPVGATAAVVQAARGGLLEAYSLGFRNSWIGSSAFIFSIFIGESETSSRTIVLGIFQKLTSIFPT